MKENFEIRAAARESLRGWWTSFVLATFVLFLISLIFSGNYRFKWQSYKINQQGS